MKKYIYLLCILINVSSPLFSHEYYINWHLILNRQTATNRYGYEFNDRKGIQDEELVPDPNGNKEVDESEGQEVTDFVFEKTNSLSAIEYLEGYSSYIRDYISAVQMEQKRQNIKETNIKTVEDLIFRLENNQREVQKEKLKFELAKNGYQVDIDRDIFYLANGSIIKGQVNNWHLSRMQRAVSIVLTEPYKFDLGEEYFYIESGVNVQFDLNSASISGAGVKDKTFPYYDREGTQIGKVIFNSYFFNPKIQYEEPFDLEKDGNKYFGLFQKMYTRDGLLHSISAESMQLHGQTIIPNVTVFFDDYGSVDNIRSKDTFNYMISGSEAELTYIAFYPDGTLKSFYTMTPIEIDWYGEKKHIPSSSRIWFYTDQSIKQVNCYHFPKSISDDNVLVLDAQIYEQEKINGEVKIGKFYPNGNYYQIEYYVISRLEFPEIGIIPFYNIIFDENQFPSHISYYDRHFKDKLITISTGDSFHIASGWAKFFENTLIAIDDVQVPITVNTPDGQQIKLTKKRQAADLYYYNDGRLKEVMSGSHHFNYQLFGEELSVNKLQFYNNGRLKRIDFTETALNIPNIGNIGCKWLEFNESGHLTDIMLASGNRIRSKVGEYSFEFAGLLQYYDGNNIRHGYLSDTTTVTLPQNNTLDFVSGTIIDFFEDGMIKMTNGLYKDTEFTLDNGDRVILLAEPDTEIEYHSNGVLKRVNYLKAPYTITFPNGATATAYHMLEYDEQGNILSLY